MHGEPVNRRYPKFQIRAGYIGAIITCVPIVLHASRDAFHDRIRRLHIVGCDGGRSCSG